MNVWGLSEVSEGVVDWALWGHVNVWGLSEVSEGVVDWALWGGGM